MAPTKKKLGSGWTENQLKAAIKAIKTGGMSQRKAAEMYCIPRRTIRNHLQTGCASKVSGRLPTLSKRQEEDLANRIKRLAAVGLPLTPKLVRKQAFEFCKANGISNIFNEKSETAGRKWLRGFLTRNRDISLRKAQFMNPGRAQKLNKVIVTKHFDSIRHLYNELDIPKYPERLYNMDEKGCRLTIHHQQQVLAEKGAKRVHLVSNEHAENVTIAMCVNAVGNAIPPMILFKGKRLRPEYCDNLPAGSLVKMAPKGSMTTDLFVDYIHFLARYKSPGKVLLIFDGAACHLDARIVDAADEHDIVLYCLPSNTTHELQPLDKSVNKSYEHHWDQEVMAYTYQHPEQKITKQRFCKIFTKVWSKCMTQGNIVNGFKATGLFPLDPSAIPEEAYAPSILTRLPSPQTDSLTQPQDNLFDTETPIFRRRPNSPDSDVTYYEDVLEQTSPNIMTIPKESSGNDIACSSTQVKIVDYSSSDDMDIGEGQQIHLHKCLRTERDFESPIPSTSGLQIRPATPNLDSYDPDSEILFSNFYLSQLMPAKRNNIYSSTSESDEENINPQTNAANTKQKSNSEESDDDVPLSKMRHGKTPFHKQIPTPNFAIVKSKPKRKALNYIGQKITKDLFNTSDDKAKKSNQKQNTKDELKCSLQRKRRQKAVKTNNVRNVAKQKSVRKVNIKEPSELWYCEGCGIDKIADMRQCKDCQKWYHEECVGLTSEDIEVFICPSCE